MDALTIAGKKERVNFLVPTDLVKRARMVAGELDCTLSDFFRVAISNFLREYETARTEKELEEGYKANYTYYANLNKEWEFADSE